jgi:hypothetical protein
VIGPREQHRVDEHDAAGGGLEHDARPAVHDRLGRRRAAWGGEHRVGGVSRLLADDRPTMTPSAE